MEKEERDRQFKLDAQNAYCQEIDRYFAEKEKVIVGIALAPFDSVRRETILNALDKEWKKVLENPFLLRTDKSGNPVANILENENGIPYFDLKPA